MFTKRKQCLLIANSIHNIIPRTLAALKPSKHLEMELQTPIHAQTVVSWFSGFPNGSQAPKNNSIMARMLYASLQK